MDDRSQTDSADLARVAARLSTDYVLRVLRLLADLYDGELFTAVVAQAIIAANTAHFDNTPEGRPSGDLPPDSARRPVSILSLAGSLGMPFETIRRHVNKLVRAGVCRRVSGGVIIPTAALDDPAFLEAAVTNLAYVQRFMRALRRAGVDPDG